MKSKLPSIFSYIKQNRDKSITEIAHHFGYSKYYFSRKFKKLTGFSASEYLSNIKLEESVDYLLSQDKSVLAAHLSAGFLSTTTFSNTFKKSVGMSPNQLKKERTQIYQNAKDFAQDTKSREVAHYDKNTLTNNKCTVVFEYPENYRAGVTYVGLFNSPIPNHKPIVGKAVINKKYCVLDNIPIGDFYLLVCSVAKSSKFIDYFVLKNCLRGKHDLPISFPCDNDSLFLIKLRTAIETDPPITISLATLLQKNMNNEKDNV